MEYEVAHTVHEAVHEMAHEAFYQDPTFWVLISFIAFMAIALKPIAKSFAKMLDTRTHQIAAELAEARRLREEAQEALTAYQKKQRESLQEAETMLAATRADAARLIEKAEIDLKLALEKRMKQATDKIAQAEAKAVADVQAYVAEISIQAAQKLMAEHLDKGGNEALVRSAVADVARKIN
jgi:F-type H+-transporting ATPase subunit b